MAEVYATAQQTGNKYNIASGEIDHPMTGISGVEAVTNSTAAEGGTDPESDNSLLERLYARLREPATSGNIYHYRQWALECDGVGEAKVIPLWNGPGTVKILIVSEEKEPVDESIIENTFKHIEDVRPIGAAVTVCTAQALDIDISVSLVLDKSITVKEVRKEFEDAIDNYFKEISLVQYTIPYRISVSWHKRSFRLFKPDSKRRNSKYHNRL